MRKVRISKAILMTGAGLVLAMGGAGLTLARAATETHQVVTGPISEYWITTSTSSGMNMAAMTGGGGGGRPSMAAMMDMMKGGVSHTMRLQLGSTQAASGDPNADHLPPTVLDVGNDLPLYYKAAVTQAVQSSGGGGSQSSGGQSPDAQPQQAQPPKGKILIFWGCGEHAPQGQPVVLDLSQLADPSARMGMMAKMAPQPVTLDTVHPPSPERWKSYGEWPNAKSSTGLDANSSLLGAHVVKGNYSPDINFTVAQSQDFLAPIQISGNARDASGAVPLQWQAMSGARGLFISVIGSGGKGADGGPILVMWTSAQVQLGWGGLTADYLTPHDADRLLTSKVLLPGETTACTVPAEVASPGGSQAANLMYSMTAYGGETNFAYPPRPDDPKVPWNIQWETKVRYRSATGGMLGRIMGGNGAMAMGGGTAAASGSSSSAASDQKKKNSMFGDLIKSRLGAVIPGGG